MNLPVFSVVTEFQQRLLIVRLGPGRTRLRIPGGPGSGQEPGRVKRAPRNLGGVKRWVHRLLRVGVCRVFKGFEPVECLARNVVEFVSDGVDFGLAVDGQVGCFWEVLA